MELMAALQEQTNISFGLEAKMATLEEDMKKVKEDMQKGKEKMLKRTDALLDRTNQLREMTDITRIELLDIVHDLTGKNPNEKKDTAPREEEEQDWKGPHTWRWNDQDWTAIERHDDDDDDDERGRREGARGCPTSG